MIRLIFILCIGIMPFSTANNDLKNKQYHNFLAAVNNNSTFNYFAVIKVENLRNCLKIKC